MKHIRRQKTVANSHTKNNSIRQGLIKTLAPIVKRRFARLLFIVSGFIVAAVAAQFASAILREAEEMQPAQSAALIAPISVNKTAAISTDNNGNGQVNPGDVVEYSITVGNGATAASGVIFSDVLSNDLTLVPGSIKAAPVAGDDSYQTIGNTQLQVAASQTISAPGIFVAGSVLSNDNDPNGGTLSASLGTVTAGASVMMNADGTFTYTPPPGFTGTDTFTYNLTDLPNDGFTVTGTVSITITDFIWYVKNNAPLGGNGTSIAPFNTLTAAQNATPAGGTIYVFAGDGTTTNQNSGITLDANQRLIGAGVPLTVPVSVNGGLNPTVLLPAGTQPMIDNTAAGGNGVTVNNVAGVEIQGLNIAGNTNAIDSTFTGAAGNLTIANNTIRAAGSEGIDINAGSTMNVALSGNTVTSTGNGIDINRTSGTMTITAFLGNTVTGNTGGIGVNIVGTGATIVFDANPGTVAFETVSGGNAVIGASGAGNGAGAGGMTLSNVRGDLSFTDLDIYADSGIALLINSTTPNFNGGAGTGMRFTANTNTPVLSAASSTALNVTDTNINLVLNSLTSSITTGTHGISLTRASGTFTAPSGSSIISTHASGTGFFIDGGSNNGANVAVTYGGTITADIGRLVQIQNVTGSSTQSFTGAITDNDDGDGGETGISLTNNSGATMTFSGGLAIRTTSNAAFTATGGGTVNVCDENPCNAGATGTLVNKLTTTTATALNVASTTIGANKLEFRSISAGTAASGPTNGIVLNNTGTSGGLSIKGNGSNCSTAANCTGGAIQRTTTAISLTNTVSPSFDRIFIDNATSSGIYGTQVANFALTNSAISNTGTSATNVQANSAVFLGEESGGNEMNVTGNVIITSNTLTNMFVHGIRVANFQGTINDIDISNNTVISATTVAASKGIGIQLLTFAANAGSRASVMNATINQNIITNFPSDSGVMVQCQNAFEGSPASTCGSGGANDIAITNNIISGQNVANRIGTQGILANAVGSVGSIANPATFNINGNQVSHVVGNGISVNIFGDAIANVTTNNNTVNANNDNQSRGISGGIGEAGSFVSDVPTLNWIITGNTVSNTHGSGIIALAGVDDTDGTLNVTIKNNNITTAPVAGNTNGIRVSHNGNNNADPTICADIQDNSSVAVPASGFLGIGLRKDGTSAAVDVFGIKGLTPSPATGAQTKTFVEGENPAGAGVLISSGSNYVSCNSAPNVAQFESNTMIENYANNVNFLNIFYQSPLELLASVEPIGKNFDNTETVSTNQTDDFIKAGSQAVTENSFADYKESAGLVVSQNQPAPGSLTNAIYPLSSALYSTAKYFTSFDFIPTAHAEETESSALMAGETVCVDGDTSTSPPCNGPGFNLPANKSTTIKFRATVNSSTTATGVSNLANVMASGGINQNSNTVNTPVVQPASISKAFGTSFMAVGGTASLTFTISNNNPSQSLTNVSYTDPLPVGLVVAAPPNVVNNCGAATITGAGGSSSISVSGLTLAVNSNCTITVDVTATSEGAKNNTTTAINSTEGGTGQTSNTATVTVIAAPSFTKAFGTPSIPLSGTTALTFSITNNSSVISLTNASFTDNLPAGLVVATPPNVTGSCGGVTANAGASSISLSGAGLAANASCMFSVDVTGTTTGVKNNTVTLSTAELGNTPTANASITVVAPPTITKSFSPDSILVGGTSTLTISITNPSANTLSLTGVGVTDNFPSGVEVDGTVNLGNSCSTGTFTPNAGDTGISISGAAISAGATCNFSVNVKATSLGAKMNTTGNVTSTEGDAGGTASATLNVGNTVTWTGATSTNWDVATNWSPAQVPSATNNAVIPNGMIPNEPVILSAEPDAAVSGLTVESERTLSINAGKTLTVNGTLSGDGTINVTGSLAAMTVNSTGLINFNGLAAQTIPTGIYKNLTLNNAAGALLAGDLTVSGVLTLNNGIVAAETNTVTFSISGISTRGGSCTTVSCFITNNTNQGGVRKQFAAGANPDFAFHVGTSGGTDNGYTPVALENINAEATGDHLIVRAVDDASPAAIIMPKITRYWQLTESGGVTADLTFTYLDADDNSIIDPADLTLYRSTTNVCITDCVDEAAFTATAESVTEFSPWTVAQTVPPAPETTIDSSPPNPSGSSSANFSFSSPTGSTFECALDGGGFSPCTSPKSYAVLTDGNHTFMVRARDSLGNADPTPSSYSWTIDTTSPDTSITTNPSNPSGTNVSFSFSGTDSGTGVASFECALDGGGFSVCLSLKNYTNLSQGSHIFQVRAIDNIGNIDPAPAAFMWIVDATPPDATIDSSPPNPSASANASFAFSGADSGGSTVTSFECSLDGGPFDACTSPQNYSSLADGGHAFQVRAIDGVGNVDASPASYTWTIDSTGPDTTINSNPSNPSNSNSASFSFTGTDAGGSGVASFECQLDGSGFTACTSPKTYNSLTDGSHTFQVRAVDNAGNIDGSPASFTWTIDAAAPDTTINSNPLNPTNSTSASFTFSGTDSGTGVASFECQLDGGGFSACTPPKNYAGLSNGSHTFQVRAIDNIDNVDPTPASFIWTVDTTAPSVTINQASGQSDPANGVGISIHFTAVFSEPVTGFGNNDVMISGTAGATTVVVTEISPMNGTTYDVSVNGMSQGGTVTASIPANRAQDAAGNQNTASTSTDNTVTYVPNTPPTANPDSYSTTQDTPLTVAAPGVLGNDSDPDAGNTITAVLVSGPTNAQSFTLNADGSFNYNPNLGFAGTDSFTYKARDNFNADSNTVTVTLSVRYRFDWVSNGMLGGSFTEQGLNQVTAGSNVALRFTLYGYKGDPYSQPPTSQQINCATSAPIGAATVINRFTPDPYYSSLYDFYQTTWQTQTAWKFTCRELTLHLNDGTTRKLKFYFK